MQIRLQRQRWSLFGQPPREVHLHRFWLVLSQTLKVTMPLQHWNSRSMWNQAKSIVFRSNVPGGCKIVGSMARLRMQQMQCRILPLSLVVFTKVDLDIPKTMMVLAVELVWSTSRLAKVMKLLLFSLEIGLARAMTSLERLALISVQLRISP